MSPKNSVLEIIFSCQSSHPTHTTHLRIAMLASRLKQCTIIIIFSEKWFLQGNYFSSRVCRNKYVLVWKGSMFSYTQTFKISIFLSSKNKNKSAYSSSQIKLKLESNFLATWCMCYPLGHSCLYTFLFCVLRTVSFTKSKVKETPDWNIQFNVM